MKGMVVRSTGSWYRVRVGQETYDCRLRGSFRTHGNKQTNPLAVGDRVDFTMQDDGTGVISSVDERRNCIIRRATKLSKQTHVIASNVDLLCVVATLGFPRTSTGFIDRLLVTAEAYHIAACVVLNKTDLYDASLWELHREVAELYTAAGYPVVATSARTGSGVEALRERIGSGTVLFSGHSGVGKSALLNAIDPSLSLRVGDVSLWSMKGQHTTTFAEIFPFGDGFLVDTPGIKEFGMVDFTSEELSHFFPEMRSRLHECRFANCTHRHEPQCAVKEAVANGEIAEERYRNYLGILDQIARGE
ncbi:MAG: ribosome small subunit-dependent GTPase A [Bacteroidales bacterium]|nr:ribosome small subunit-dependent GTPase A [Bacteroidales bacterium]